MKLSDFDYDLPQEQIAFFPAGNRDESRLLVFDRARNQITHAHFSDLPDFLLPEDFLVINTTRVLKARLFGRKSVTGGKCELLLLREINSGLWHALVKPARGMAPGIKVEFTGSSCFAEVVEINADGSRLMRFYPPGEVHNLMDQVGAIPLPPYIQREPTDSDLERYQTIYSKEPGSVAAPTAGLHFSEKVMTRIRGKSIEFMNILLDIGWGTFRPIRDEDPRQHKMEFETFRISADSAGRISNLKHRGQKLVAVGTTSVRALESWFRLTEGRLGAVSAETDLFIHAPYEFKLVDKMITNFHLPKSTLLMLVSAFAGRERILDVYREAIKAGYRFFSYGDCMLIL